MEIKISDSKYSQLSNIVLFHCIVAYIMNNEVNGAVLIRSHHIIG